MLPGSYHRTMLELSRTVRFCLPADPQAYQQPRSNTHAAWPPPSGLDPYFEITVVCKGQADVDTGYFINIKDIDTAVREVVLPILRQACHPSPSAAASPVALPHVLMRSVEALQPHLRGTVHQLTLALTPRTTMTFTPTPTSTSASASSSPPPGVTLAQRYEFSAAHRLHTATLTDEQNRETFGKCNNPHGHGHNYQVEVQVHCPVDEQGRSVSFAQLDQAVDTHVIEPLDHKHLNEQVPAFANLNPSVENISRVVWDMLAEHVPGRATLEAVTVWETPKTACTYRGGGGA